jgi:hypothetical protein
MRATLAVAVLLVLTGDVSPAFAQDPRQALFRGLFGGAAPLPSREHMLDLSASAFAGYVETLTQSPEPEVPEAWFRGGSGSLSYQRLWTDASVGAFAVGGTSYSDQLEEAGESPWLTRWHAGTFGSYSKRLGRRTRFSTGATVAYSPQYRFGMSGISPGSIGQGVSGLGGFGVGPDRIDLIPGLDYSIADQPTLYTTANAHLTREFSARSNLEFYYSGNHVTFLDEDPEQDFDDSFAQTAGVRYRHAINRYVSARAGYGYSRSKYQDEGRPSGNHVIDIGVDGGYGREFQISRRTTFDFNTNSNVIVHDTVRDDDEYNPQTRLFVGGSMGLAHRWGRSWQARAEVWRGTGFVDSFADPVTTNRATVSLGGVPHRRVDVVGYVSYIGGTVGFDEDSGGYATSTAVFQTRFAASRNIAVFGQYFYYYYRFDQGVTLPGTIDRRLERQGGSVGVTFWLPLL